MRGRTILMLLAVLVVLGGIGILFEAGRNRQTHVSGAILFPGLKTEVVDRIRVRWSKKESVLEKKNGKWLVASEGDHPVEPHYVSDILERLPKFYADEVVSTNPANQSVFMVDTSGVEVWVDQSGKEIGHFIVGKPGPDFLSTYVRPAGSDRVILVPDYLPNLFQRSDTWRARTIFQLNPDSIRSFEYQSPSRGHVVLKKTDAGNWRMESPDTGQVNASTVQMPLRSFATLKAAGFADTVSAATAGIEPDTSRIDVTTADGSDYTLHVGGPTAMNRCYARKKGDDQIITLPRGAINTMMPPPPVLKATPGAEFQGPGGKSSAR